jgi:hypothetical protein
MPWYKWIVMAPMPAWLFGVVGILAIVAAQKLRKKNDECGTAL